MKLPRQFRLASIFLFTAVLALCLGIWVRQVHQRKDLIAWIQKNSGSPRLTYAHQLDANGRLDEKAQPLGPRWLRRLLGDEAFCEVETVGLRGARVTDADLRRLVVFRQISAIEIDATRVTPKGLRALRQLPRLHYLRLSGLAADDEGMAEVAHLEHLERFWLMGPGGNVISDKGLLELRALPNVQRLDLDRVEVSGAAIAALRKGLPKCRIVLTDGSKSLEVP
ncbi:MAG TPA: hypothetical protein VG125_06730 [Pirellulales bacterium]|jgi:hypothetical protein|nr:hypothetical protein [Pirellulales bacterium]